ncbi:hypothetical protein C0991_002276, partial [Blastosporella zonata]
PLPSSFLCGLDVDELRETIQSKLPTKIQPQIEREILGAIDNWTTPQPYPQKGHAYELPRDVQPPSTEDKVKIQEPPPTTLYFLPPPGVQPAQCEPSDHAQVAPQSSPLLSSPFPSFESSLPSEKHPLHLPPTPRTENDKQLLPQPSDHLTTVLAESSGGPVQNVETDTISDLPLYFVSPRSRYSGEASSLEQTTKIHQPTDASIPSIPNEHGTPDAQSDEPGKAR